MVKTGATLQCCSCFFIFLVNDFSKQGGCSGACYLDFDKVAYLVVFSVEYRSAVLLGAAVELFF